VGDKDISTKFVDRIWDDGGCTENTCQPKPMLWQGVPGKLKNAVIGERTQRKSTGFLRGGTLSQ